MVYSLLATIVVTALLNPVHAIPTHSNLFPREVTDGINDKGNIKCEHVGHNNVMDNIQKAVDLIKPGTEYTAGEQIACLDDFCASLCDNTPYYKVEASSKNDDEFRNMQQTNGQAHPKTNVGDVIGDLRYINAKVCGTAPIHREEGEGHNQNSRGCITVNYSSDICQRGRAIGVCIKGDPCPTIPGGSVENISGSTPGEAFADISEGTPEFCREPSLK
ncbi:MAG: hypothetical protein Q9169_002247 [Polycauliona sp. 2 TL-2023]